MESMIGKNVRAEIDGQTLVIRVDLSKNYGPSKSGKTTVIGTTSGFARVTGPAGEVSIGLNVIR